MLVSISSTVSLPYSVMIFLGVPVELATMMIFAPVSIHSDCLDLSARFSLNRLPDLDYPSKSSGRSRMALSNSLIPVVEKLACPGVRSKGMAAGALGAGLGAPHPAGTVPPPPPMTFVPVAVEAEMDLVDLSIFMVVTLGSRCLLYLLIRLTYKDNQCRYLLY